MTVSRFYRIALHVLPVELRRKHGAAMESLFSRELEHARARGRLPAALSAVAGVLDVVQRGAYELVRPVRNTSREDHDSQLGEQFSMNPAGTPTVFANYGELHMNEIKTGGPHEPLTTTRELLGRHAASFAIAFAVLTSVLLFVFASRQIPALRANGASAAKIAELLLLSLPFIAAMTIPMAVFVAVIHQFTRLGANGTLVAARRERDGVRRLVAPVLAAAAGMTVLAFAVTTELVPRSNERLSAVLRGDAATPSDRTMTITQLREAARNVGPRTDAVVHARAAAFEVEVQKKLALPVACLVLALAGIALAFRIPHGGTWLVFGASVVCFSAYYFLLMTGEVLADRLVVSPFVGMWGANVFFLTTALLGVWRRRAPFVSGGPGPVAIRS